MRKFCMDDINLVLLNKLTYSSMLLPSVHSKTFMMETFFKIINFLSQCYQFWCYSCVVYIFSKNIKSNYLSEFKM